MIYFLEIIEKESINQKLYDIPARTAYLRNIIPSGDSIQILALDANYYLAKTKQGEMGWVTVFACCKIKML